MDHDPVFLEPVLKERLWGGTRLRDDFHYDIPSNHTGECWGISTHPNGETRVREGAFSGMRLSRLWNTHRELFGSHPSNVFPLLVKIIDATQDLSVQVHPNDAYAKRHGEKGKTECWYVIDCKENAELIYGHYAGSREALKKMIDQGEWQKLLGKKKIQPGDFIYVPSGTVHALPAGSLILETQQNSDTTYRVYDFDRADNRGRKRELHVEKALDVIMVPHQENTVHPVTETSGDLELTTFIRSEHFAVKKWYLQGRTILQQKKNFILVSVLDGEGRLYVDHRQFDFKKGDHMILLSGMGAFEAEGRAEGILSYV